jgi:nucleotide-binding universal stress UspA family protein
MFTKLLLAIDDSPSRFMATAFTAALAQSYRASVHVLHVNEQLKAGRGLTLLTLDESTDLVGEAIGQLRDASVQANGAVHVAPYRGVAQDIVREAHRANMDAIVLGSQRHKTFGRLFSSHVRAKITRHTALPVLIAPSPLNLSSPSQLDVDALVRESIEQDLAKLSQS